MRSTCSWAVEYGRLGLKRKEWNDARCTNCTRLLIPLLPHSHPPDQETIRTGLNLRRTRPWRLYLPPHPPPKGRLLVALRRRVHCIISPYSTRTVIEIHEKDIPMRNHPLGINNPLPRHIPCMEVLPGFLRGEMFQFDSDLAGSFCCPHPAPVNLLI